MFLWQIAVLLGEDEAVDYDGGSVFAGQPIDPDAPPTGPVLRAFD